MVKWYFIPLIHRNEQKKAQKHWGDNRSKRLAVQENLVAVRSFDDSYGISHSLPEGISTKQVPNTGLHKLPLRSAL
jgi:hypothetical protein